MSDTVKLAKEIDEPYDINQPTEECHLMAWPCERGRFTQRCDLRPTQGGEEDTEERVMMLHTEMCEKSESGRRRRSTRTPAAPPTPIPTWSPSEDSAASETCGTSETKGSPSACDESYSDNECMGTDINLKRRCTRNHRRRELGSHTTRLQVDGGCMSTMRWIFQPQTAGDWKQALEEFGCESGSDDSDGSETNDARCTMPRTACIAKATKIRPDEHWYCVVGTARFARFKARQQRWQVVVTCILVQRHKATSQEGAKTSHLCFEHSKSLNDGMRSPWKRCEGD